MATVTATEAKKGSYWKLMLVEGMDHLDDSTVIDTAGYNYAYFFGGDGGSAVNPTSTASLLVAANVDGTAFENQIPEDANNVRHLRMAISTGGVVTAGYLDGPLPNLVNVTLQAPAAGADWDVYILLLKDSVSSRGN